MDPSREGTWLIDGTKHRKDNQLQCLDYPVEYPSREYKFNIKESDCNMLNPIFSYSSRYVQWDNGGHNMSVKLVITMDTLLGILVK